MSNQGEKSSQGIIVPPRPKEDYLEVMGFIEGADKIVSFKGKISLKEIKEFVLNQGAKIEIKVNGFSSFKNFEHREKE